MNSNLGKVFYLSGLLFQTISLKWSCCYYGSNTLFTCPLIFNNVCYVLPVFLRFHTQYIILYYFMLFFYVCIDAVCMFINNFIAQAINIIDFTQL